MNVPDSREECERVFVDYFYAHTPRERHRGVWFADGPALLKMRRVTANPSDARELRLTLPEMICGRPVKMRPGADGIIFDGNPTQYKPKSRGRW